MRRCDHTGKIRYRDQLDARIALLNTSRRRSRKKTAKQERTIYRCSYCAGWHLSSYGPEGAA